MKFNKTEAVSSGGVVARMYHGNVEVLLLRDTRYKDWTLPKGHVEKNETLIQAAMREIREEAGITRASIITELGSFRRYVKKAREWKTIHYFLMLAAPNEPKDNPESAHTKTAWFQLDKLPKMYLPEQAKVIKDNQETIKLIKEKDPRL